MAKTLKLTDEDVRRILGWYEDSEMECGASEEDDELVMKLRQAYPAIDYEMNLRELHAQTWELMLTDSRVRPLLNRVRYPYPPVLVMKNFDERVKELDDMKELVYQELVDKLNEMKVDGEI